MTAGRARGPATALARAGSLTNRVVPTHEPRPVQRRISVRVARRHVCNAPRHAASGGGASRGPAHRGGPVAAGGASISVPRRESRPACRAARARRAGAALPSRRGATILAWIRAARLRDAHARGSATRGYPGCRCCGAAETRQTRAAQARPRRRPLRALCRVRLARRLRGAAGTGGGGKERANHVREARPRRPVQQPRTAASTSESQPYF